MCSNWQLNQGLIIAAPHEMMLRSVRILLPWVGSTTKLVESHFLHQITVGFHWGSLHPRTEVSPIAHTNDLGSVQLCRDRSHTDVLQIWVSQG